MRELFAKAVRLSQRRAAWAVLAVAAVSALALVAWLTAQETVPHGARAPKTAAVKPVHPAVIDHFNRELPVPANFDSPQMRQLKRAALGGDAGAAFDLGMFYEACAMHNKFLGPAPGRPTTAECLREYESWIRIAAENGEAGSQTMLLWKSLDSSRCEEVYRARFWFQKLRQQGAVPQYGPTEEDLSAKEKNCEWGRPASSSAAS